MRLSYWNDSFSILEYKLIELLKQIKKTLVVALMKTKATKILVVILMRTKITKTLVVALM